MSGINRKLTLDIRHIPKHLPNTPEMLKLLNKEGFVHVFKDEATMKKVAQAIMNEGEFTGVIRGHERYGVYFSEPIGYRLSIDGTQIPLYYGEIKVTRNKYHVIPRTRRS